MKKRIVSMLLALALVVTGIPSDLATGTAYAAEVTQEQQSAVLSDEAEETDGVVENNDASQKALHSESGDLYAFNVANGKAIGSDGVVYDDVVYLSADAVNALNTDAQNAYFAFCDEIADAKKEGIDLNDVVAAVDENGTLVFHYAIPIEALTTAMNELSEELMEPAEVQNETKEDKVVSEEDEIATQEDEIASEEDEMASKEEETTDVQTTDDEAVEETDVVSAEETTADVASSEEAVSEEKTETVTDENNVEETVTEEGTEAVEDQYVLSAENMELITVTEAEEFPVVEKVKADLIVDLGYNNSDIQQLNSILPAADHFSSQLSKNQIIIYNACKGMLKGTNKFKFTATSKLTYADFCQAVSAHVMTNPYQCDWMDLSSTGVFEVIAWYYSESDPTYDWEVTIGKSKYYNASLVKAANAKVLELAEAAQKDALKKYPQAPVYGIVEYFDDWICNTNYYNQLGVTGGSAKDRATQEAYYYCHSSYGILLKGYGVCESYALAMTRLLDAIGIPNMYATGQMLDENGNFIVDAKGDLAGGHAWNYIYMPDGKWYLQDSTWNDSGQKDEDGMESLQRWLLSGDDGLHFPMGNRYKYNKNSTVIFDFVPLSKSYYNPANANESITLSKTEINLLPKKTDTLSCSSVYISSNENIPKVWASSNEKVAKVDKNGKVTAVAPGSAEITLTAAGMSAKCTVNVHQINTITFEEGGKASLTTSCGIVDGKKPEIQHIYLTVNQKAENPAYTAEELNTKGVFDDFNAKSSNENIATVTKSLTGNRIDLAIQPVSKGKTTITVTFGTKKATLNFSVSEKLDESWFDLKEVDDLKKDGDNGTLVYTGKAYKPKVVLTQEGKNKKVKFKVTYKNNKDAGTASVVITGTGTFGGEIKRDFTINPLVLNVDTASIKVTDKPVLYNGGANLTKSTVKHAIKVKDKKDKLVGLKAGKDYDILYTKKGTTTSTTEPKEIGEYTMVIVGKGNYAGVDDESKNKPTFAIRDAEDKDKIWTIKANDIKKVKVTVKVTGTTPAVTVAIGKNELPATDYTMGFYKDKNCTESVSPTSFAAKTQYFVKIDAPKEGSPDANGANVTVGSKSKPIIKSFKTK